MIYRLKDKAAWWLVKRLPKRVLLYAFVYVHALKGDAPEYNGEYSQAYKLWTAKHGLK
jgi:hypothetical protein